MTGEPGSAMHLHQSIIDIETGKYETKIVNKNV